MNSTFHVILRAAKDPHAKHNRPQADSWSERSKQRLLPNDADGRDIAYTTTEFPASPEALSLRCARGCFAEFTLSEAEGLTMTWGSWTSVEYAGQG